MKNIDFLTKQQCTVFCKVKNRDEVLKSLNDWILSGSELKKSYDENGNLVVKILNSGTEIEFFIFVRKEGGDSVSKTLLGAYNYFKRITTENESNKKYVLSRISKCNASIGIVGKPEFTQSSKHFEYILSLALCFNGIIFNGSGAVNEKGELILGADGSCSIKY